MPDIIEVNERPATLEEIQRDYVDINGAAQILNDVSTKTAYSYMAKALERHSIKVKVIDHVSNGAAKKLYRRSDIIEVAKILNKDKSVISYETVIIRPDIATTSSKNGITEVPKHDVLEGHSNSFQNLPRPLTAKMYFGALTIGLLILIASVLLVRGLLINEFDRQSRQIASLKSYITHKKI